MSFRPAMIWLHTWAGLVPGWVLYFVFVTGTAGYFTYEIDRWMQPAIPIKQTPFKPEDHIASAEQRLRQLAPDATEVYMEFPLDRYPFFALWWHNPKQGEDGGWHSEKLDPNTGEPVLTRETGGGRLLYRMHYNLHYMPRDLAYVMTSLASMFMLVAIISGIVIHRRIFKDFFRFRQNKNLRSWRDAHNLVGVLPLPFHIMISYSGLMLLMFNNMPLVATAGFGFEQSPGQAYRKVFPEEEHRVHVGIAAPSVPLAALYKDALDHTDNPIAFIGVHHPGDQNAVVEMGVVADRGVAPYDPIHYDAVSGERFTPADHSDETSAPRVFYETMEGLHEGRFADPLLRWLYFLTGLLGAAMVATGNLLWAESRRKKHTQADYVGKRTSMVDSINLATIAGFPIAIAAYFWANRLLPVDLVNRAQWEVHCIYIVWLLMLIHPLIRRNSQSLRALWVEQLKLASCVYGLIPVINVLTSENHLGTALLYGDWILVGFDGLMLALALCFGGAAYVIGKDKPEAEPSVLAKSISV